MIQREQHIRRGTSDKVLEAVLLLIVNKLLGGSVDNDDRITRSGCSCEIVPAGILNFDVEVYKAHRAPAEVIIGEVEANAIAH